MGAGAGVGAGDGFGVGDGAGVVLVVVVVLSGVGDGVGGVTVVVVVVVVLSGTGVTVVEDVVEAGVVVLVVEVVVVFSEAFVVVVISVVVDDVVVLESGTCVDESGITGTASELLCCPLVWTIKHETAITANASTTFRNCDGDISPNRLYLLNSYCSVLIGRREAESIDRSAAAGAGN